MEINLKSFIASHGSNEWNCRWMVNGEWLNLFIQFKDEMWIQWKLKNGETHNKREATNGTQVPGVVKSEFSFNVWPKYSHI